MSVDWRNARLHGELRVELALSVLSRGKGVTVTRSVPKLIECALLVTKQTKHESTSAHLSSKSVAQITNSVS